MRRESALPYQRDGVVVEPPELEPPVVLPAPDEPDEPDEPEEPVEPDEPDPPAPIEPVPELEPDPEAPAEPEPDGGVVLLVLLLPPAPLVLLPPLPLLLPLALGLAPVVPPLLPEPDVLLPPEPLLPVPAPLVLVSGLVDEPEEPAVAPLEAPPLAPPEAVPVPGAGTTGCWVVVVGGVVAGVVAPPVVVLTSASSRPQAASERLPATIMDSATPRIRGVRFIRNSLGCVRWKGGRHLRRHRNAMAPESSAPAVVCDGRRL
ncbi:hypothetical protein WG922_06905 [Ramlibacter sp. AN1015]|uniref:hypothetical protein n=1 Tax=Ramlibacter sp. AN1015 TaxID=3133428 RepID=UPI0030BAA834